MSETQEQEASGNGEPDLPTTIRVTLKTLDDREATVTIGLQDTIQSLIDLGRREMNIQSGFQRVIAGGRVLNSTQTVQAAGISDGQTVHLVDRGPSGENDRPNVMPDRVAGPRIINAIPGLPPPGFIFQSPAFARMIPGNVEIPTPPSQTQHTVVHPIRVPGSIAGTPVLTSRVSEDCVLQKAVPYRGTSNSPNRPQAASQTVTFPSEPNVIQWTVNIADDLIFRPREHFEQVVRETINNISFLSDSTRLGVSMKWNQNCTSLSVELPPVSPHIPSPALEKLDFLCLWTDHLSRFIDKLEEHDGLVAATRHVLEMVKTRQFDQNLSQQARNQRVEALDEIVKHLEYQWAELSHMKDFERIRFRKNQTEEYRALKIQEYPETPRNPHFYMRHALDIDVIGVMREFRKQQRRFTRLEDLLDDLNEVGAVKFIRDHITTEVDYRYQALSMFYCYIQRMRHQISHMTHLTADLDVSFITPSFPQRILPQYAVNVLTVPFPHPATVIFKFQSSDEQPLTIPVTHIFEPPRMLSDVGGRYNGDYPYLAYHPPSVHMEVVLQEPRRIAEPRPQILARPTPQQFVLTQEMNQGGSINLMAATDPISGLSLQDVLRAQQEQVENLFAQQPGIEGGRVRVTARPGRRFVATTGDAPSVPVETLPPPGSDQQPGTSRRFTTHRFNVQPDARGAETETLAPFPVAIEPNELQRIAKNIASRYRAEALQRIASSLTTRFNNESWDTRIQNMPLCTLRECVAIALEMLTSAGNTVNESKDLMLALVRDEEVLVRAIAECIKSLFGRGEFPTHVARLIMPTNQTASSRNDYESVDGVEESQSDEFDSMIVRVPSDISQPQSGDLRAIRERRQNRRQFLENRGRIPSTSSAPSTSENPPGPSFNSEDAADIRAGRLPLGTRPNRRTVRETVHPAAAARAESPNHISLTFTATTHTFAPAGFPLMMASSNVPSTSAGPPGWPIRQVVSPTPTTRGLFEFDLSGSSDQPARSTPSPPAPTPRTTSAPATVQSSPTRQESMDIDSPNVQNPGHVESPAAIAARQAARVARARIDHLAATFNGDLADSRRQSPFVTPGPTTPLNDPRRRTVRVTQHVKPMVAIDPFMNCTNRHCEINRLATPTHMADGDRFTLQSLQPDQEFEARIQALVPSIERRPIQIHHEDEDYNYSIRRTQSGLLSFRNLEDFRPFVKTAIRSLLAHCIDADTLFTMNMNNISGYQAANHTELLRMVKEHISRVPGSRATRNASQNTTSVNQSTETSPREQMNRSPVQEAADPRLAFSPFPPGINLEQEVLIPGQIASLLTYLVDYMESSSNPRPPGIFGFLLELTYGRLTRHDFAQLARRTTATNVASEFEAQIRAHIRDNYLVGRTGLSNSELHGIAENLANNEQFFAIFMSQNDQLPTSFPFGYDRNDFAEVVWAFRQIEIALIKSFLTLSQLNLVSDSGNAVRFILQSVDSYLYRNLIMFYRMCDRDVERMKIQMKRISDYFATIRYESTDRPGINVFIDNWNRVMDYWSNRYTDFSEENFDQFLLKVRAGTDWNDIVLNESRQLLPTIASTSSQPSTSSSSLNTVSTNNPSLGRLIWTQIRRFFQENAITTAVARIMMTVWMWWHR
ncbi:Ubiquitin-like domain-containing protein [Caenorhabditis elegans]|uniref:Ubiquitin-like domain-containing protein n=1 Tax=Caenorhabditis elegans TaxID=6239 RepID=L8EC34_CAEEL|nr:Ubiquitin-like domain-containing protein [Caenorhabditis elegans]CCQ25681.2 Ubiquitin-like domain-containing protein [Caenorhabditis elegans]